MNLADGTAGPVLNTEINASSLQWSPDGKNIGFLYRKEKGKRQVWAMPAGGGEMVQLTHAESDISSFRWNPAGGELAYLALSPPTEREKALEDRGYGFI